MNYAIELVFDEESQKAINDLRTKLNENGVHDEAVKLNHVSIGDYKTDNIEELENRVIEFSKTIKPFELSYYYFSFQLLIQNLYVALFANNDQIGRASCRERV